MSPEVSLTTAGTFSKRYPSAEHQLVVLKGEYSVSAAEKTPEGEAEAPGEGGARPVVCER